MSLHKDPKRGLPEQNPRLENAFQRIRDAVRQFGSAGDAVDRGYTLEADRMEREATQDLRQVLEQNPGLAARMPRLRSALDSGAYLANSGWDILAELDQAQKSWLPDS